MKINKICLVCSLLIIGMIAMVSLKSTSTFCSIYESKPSMKSATIVVSDDFSAEPLIILDTVTESGQTDSVIITNNLPPINALLVIRDKGGTFKIPALAKTSQPPVAPENPYLKR